MRARAALACLLWVSSSVAWADAAAEDAAREYNRVAKDAFKAEDYEKAVANFERAFELLPDPKVRLNLALANDNLYRLDEAKDHYEAFLRENPRSDKAEQVRGKLTSVERKMKQLGKLVIQVSPAPDRASVDGKAYQAVPIRVWLAPGKHKLHVEKAGHAPKDQDVEVKAAARGEVRVELVASETAAPVSTPVAAAPAPERPAPPTAPPDEKPAPPPSEADPASPTPTQPQGARPLIIATRVAGALGLGAGVLALLVGVLGGAMSAWIFGVRWYVPGTDAFTNGMLGGFVVGLVILGVGLLLTPLLGAAGLAVLVASFFL